MIDMRKLRTRTRAALIVLLMARGLAQPAPHSSYLPGPASAAPASTAAAAAAPSGDLAFMDIEKLMDIKVTTASLFSDKLSQAPSIMSVVTRDELRRFRGLTLNEVLQPFPV